MFVDRRVRSQFRVERRGENMSLFDQRGLPFELGQNTDACSNFFDDRTANEHHFQRIFLQRRATEENVAGKLAAVAIA